MELHMSFFGSPFLLSGPDPVDVVVYVEKRFDVMFGSGWLAAFEAVEKLEILREKVAKELVPSTRPKLYLSQNARGAG